MAKEMGLSRRSKVGGRVSELLMVSCVEIGLAVGYQGADLRPDLDGVLTLAFASIKRVVTVLAFEECRRLMAHCNGVAPRGIAHPDRKRIGVEVGIGIFCLFLSWREAFEG